ncbi:TPA: helix-turn-helix-type transcriptional regulator, partial [Klebsiella oxytoca]|nr:helix-turn-helix-type transcriptional regulator [Klebsiella oxytoca]
RKWLLVTTGKLSPARQRQIERWQQQVVSLEIVAL